MKISKDKYGDVVNALDGIRCDNRENQQHSENENDLRKIDQDVMQYIERKGYCKYIYGANSKFVRTLTEKGYEILQYMDYEEYRKQKAIRNYKSWLPLLFSAIAIGISIWAVLHKSNESQKIEQLETKLGQADSLSNSLKDSINSLNLRMTKVQNPNIYSLTNVSNASDTPKSNQQVIKSTKRQ